MGRLTDRLPTGVLERARDRYRAARYARAQRITTRYLADRLRRDAAERAMVDYLAADVRAATVSAFRRYSADDYRRLGFLPPDAFHDYALPRDVGYDASLDACMARHPAGGSSLLAGGAPSVPTRGAAELVEDSDGAPHAAGVQDIAAERANQVLKGYTREHDAAEHSVMDFAVQAGHVLGLTFVNKPWCRRSSPIREPNRLDLVRAGALIAAAIDRWDSRAEQSAQDTR